ncbi:hypothetical protein SAMN05444274_1297, partial [Mariniphaga anaerophila]
MNFFFIFLPVSQALKRLVFLIRLKNRNTCYPLHHFLNELRSKSGCKSNCLFLFSKTFQKFFFFFYSPLSIPFFTPEIILYHPSLLGVPDVWTFNLSNELCPFGGCKCRPFFFPTNNFISLFLPFSKTFFANTCKSHINKCYSNVNSPPADLSKVPTQ